MVSIECFIQGHDAPTDGDIYRMGKDGKKREDPMQSIPRPSKEGQDVRWHDFEVAMEGAFKWISDLVGVYPIRVTYSQNLIKSVQMDRLLPPGSYTHIQAACEMLPGGSRASGVYPFGGLVINFNVVTRVHRDSKDEEICLVLAIVEGEGGELVFFEPGVVVPMQNGDLVLFRSTRISHFNLDFKGKRCSIVFHSDGAGRSWVNDCSGWANKSYFS